MLIFFVWYFIVGLKQSGNDKLRVESNNRFKKSNIRNHGPAFSGIQHAYVAPTSTIQSPHEINNRWIDNNNTLNPYDFKRQTNNKSPLNLLLDKSKDNFDLPSHEHKQKVQKHTDSSVLPVQQDLCLIPNLQHPQVKFSFNNLSHFIYLL